MMQGDVDLTIRIDAHTAARIAEHVKRMGDRGQEGVKVTRTDAIRNLLAVGLKESERNKKGGA
jgi:hypothetical protein